MGATKLHTAVEEHGTGKQLVRCRLRPSFSAVTGFTLVALAVLAVAAALGGAVIPAAVLGAAFALGTARLVAESGSAVATLDQAASEAFRAAEKDTV